MQCKCKSQFLHCALFLFSHIGTQLKSESFEKKIMINLKATAYCDDIQMCDGILHSTMNCQLSKQPDMNTHKMLQVAMCTRRGEERGRCGFYIGAMAPPGWTHVEAHTLFIHSEYLTGDLRIICTSRKTQHTKCSISKSKKITRPSVNYANDWLDQFLFPSLEKCSTWMLSVGRI